MLNLRSFLLLILSIGANFIGIAAYSQVLVSGPNGEDSENGPRIFKALNTDLIFPKFFNTSDNVVRTTESIDVSVASTSSSTELTPSSTTQPPWLINYPLQSTEDQVPIFVTPTTPKEQKPNVGEVQDSMDIIKDKPLDTPYSDHEQPTSTGRAVDYRSGYPFGQLLTPLIRTAAPATYRQQRPQQLYRHPSPLNKEPSRVIYIKPQTSSGYYTQPRKPSRAEIDKVKGKAPFMDRFAPSEGTAAAQFSKHRNHDHSHVHSHDHSHNHNHAPDPKVPAPSNFVQNYVPPKDTYAFPPLNANYPAPSDDPKAALPTSSITSYLPPASGPLSASGYQYVATPSGGNDGYQYPGPLKPSSEGNKSANDGKENNGADDGDGDNDDTIGVLPASAMDMTGDAGKDAAGVSAGDDIKTADPGADDHHHDDHAYDPNMEYPTPPPGWLEAHPDSAAPKPADHDQDPPDHHHDSHDHGSSDYSDLIQYPHGFPSFSHDHYPIIYDHHGHDHHHVEPPIEPPPPPPPLPTTEPPPPPEPAPEARVKKYSYFYIGRKLWYIPLYFTVWFSFYVLWLIVKSIARHKVNLPNHYVNRRSISDYDNETKQRDEYINDLTVSILGHIDSFKQKYLTQKIS